MPRKRPTIIRRNEPARDDPRARFLIELARALGTYNVAAHRLEEAVQSAAAALNLHAQIFSTPTSVFVSIEIKDHRETQLARVNPQAPNLSKLVALDEIHRYVIEGRLTPNKGTRLIKRVIRRPPRYPTWLHTSANVVTAACVARFFGGGMREVAAAAIIGLAVGLLELAVRSRRDLARLIEFICGTIAATLAALLAIATGGLAIELTTIAGLISLMPGMTITTAMSELATRNLVSGTARFVGGITVVLAIGFGVAVGQTLMVDYTTGYDIAPIPLPDWTQIAAAFIAPTSFVVLFNGRARDTLLMVAAGTGSFFIARASTAAFGTEFGVAAAAAAVGIAGNLYGRLYNRPVQTFILPGIIMMVPGSLSFRSFEKFLENDTISGTQTAFAVLVTALALAFGLLLANVVAAPKRSL